MTATLRAHLQVGQVIPAHPLALTAARTLDESRQRALTRYYVDAGAGGVAVGVHTTQFNIRDRGVDLYQPVLALAADEVMRARRETRRPIALVAGVCGRTEQALSEAACAVSLGYDVGLLSFGAWQHAHEGELIAHARAVADVIPLFGF